MSAITNDITSTSQIGSTTDAFSALGSQEFLEIIFTEMTNQDPLAPNETKDLLAQLSTIRSIESDLDLQNNLKDILQQNQIASAGALIGKFVYGRNEFNDEAAGYVASVTITDDGPVLNLNNGFSIPMDKAEEIIDPDLIESLADETTPAPTPAPIDPVPDDPDPEPEPVPTSSARPIEQTLDF
ncbi:MAG: flagellar hook capping FlgD N-terminal domain-containing protein [Planctomycetota bacterium]|jgi:flagellar basal-body rod modification protein FlgD